MAMQVGTPDGEDEVNSTINTTPLVDVMLVLLIIFLLTIPAAIPTVPVELPIEENQPTQTQPENIILAVDADGQLYWNDRQLPDVTALFERLKTEAVKVPQPEVHIRGDAKARYKAIGQVVFTCQRAGIIKVGFITEPPPRG